MSAMGALLAKTDVYCPAIQSITLGILAVAFIQAHFSSAQPLSPLVFRCVFTTLEKLSQKSDGPQTRMNARSVFTTSIARNTSCRNSMPVIRRSRSWQDCAVVVTAPALCALTWLRQVSLHRKPSNPARLRRRHFVPQQHARHSTVTLLARLLGLSTSVPRAQAVW